MKIGDFFIKWTPEGLELTDAQNSYPNAYYAYFSREEAKQLRDFLVEQLGLENDPEDSDTQSDTMETRPAEFLYRINPEG